MEIQDGTVTASLQESLLLQTWLSPSMPTGAFSYSHGIEAAIESGHIDEAADLLSWLRQLLANGSLHNESVLFGMAWHAATSSDSDALADVDALALALAGCAERHAESVQQAASLRLALKAWPQVHDSLDQILPDTRDVSHAIERINRESEHSLAVVMAVSLVCTGASLERALALWLQALLANLVWIAVRLRPFGQGEGLLVVADLQSSVERKSSTIAEISPESLPDALGSCSALSDILAIHHETLGTRLCVS